MIANGLVTSGILVPRLQFTLRGFMARTTTDEALSFKLLITLAKALACNLEMVLPLIRLPLVCLSGGGRMGFVGFLLPLADINVMY